jgi:hypothetical protein
MRTSDISPSKQVVHMRRTALASAVAVALLAPAAAHAVPLTLWTTGAGAVSIRQPQPLPAPRCSFDRCVYDLAQGAPVRLTVAPSRFRGWVGPCSPGTGPLVCTFFLNGPATVGARFIAPPGQQTGPQCNGDVCTDAGPLSGGVTVKVKVIGPGAVNVRSQLPHGIYNRTCSTSCLKFTVAAGTPVRLQVVRGMLDHFVGPYGSSNSSVYQVPAFPPSAGNKLMTINANFAF